MNRIPSLNMPFILEPPIMGHITSQLVGEVLWENFAKNRRYR